MNRTTYSILVKALLIHEANSYKPKKDITWITSATDLVLDEIEKIDQTKYSYVSITNRIGIDMNDVKLNLLINAKDNPPNRTFKIMICDCGELSHLIHISRNQ